MSLLGVYHSLERRVRFQNINISNRVLTYQNPKVTEMLVAVLNCCSKEELDESSDEEQALVSPSTAERESAERRQIIKNKILAVGRISRVFSLLRFVSIPDLTTS